MLGYGNSMYIYNHGIFAQAGVLTDADALAFITAASITDTTQKNAINQLVLDLKSANIWTKMKAIYPFVGGSASSHRFNLKAPTTNNSDFYITFTGGWTHSSTGVTPDGTSGYADTKLVPSSVLGQNSTHVSYYSRTNSGVDGYDFGTNSSASNTNMIYGIIKSVAGNAHSRINRSTGETENLITNSNSAVWYMVNRSSSSQENIYINTTQNNFTKLSDGVSAYSIFLGAINRYGTPATYSSRECAFATIGDGLNNTEATALYNAIQTYQTTLGRQV